MKYLGTARHKQDLMDAARLSLDIIKSASVFALAHKEPKELVEKIKEIKHGYDKLKQEAERL
jgi:hypothetical protein